MKQANAMFFLSSAPCILCHLCSYLCHYVSPHRSGVGLHIPCNSIPQSRSCPWWCLIVVSSRTLYTWSRHVRVSWITLASCWMNFLKIFAEPRQRKAITMSHDLVALASLPPREGYQSFAVIICCTRGYPGACGGCSLTIFAQLFPHACAELFVCRFSCCFHAQQRFQGSVLNEKV